MATVRVQPTAVSATSLLITKGISAEMAPLALVVPQAGARIRLVSAPQKIVTAMVTVPFVAACATTTAFLVKEAGLPIHLITIA